MKRIFLLSFIICSISVAQYHSYGDLVKSLELLASQNPSLIKLQSIAKTLNGKEVWSVTIGKNETNKAVLIVGGIEATQIVGTEHALRLIEHLSQSYGKNDSITRLLDNTTIYVIPQANPDAAEAFSTKPFGERGTNFTPYDDDRDGETDEDDVEDLNKDGIISWMRIKDPRGDWIVNPDDSRLMKKADAAKNEKGIYRLLSRCSAMQIL